MNFQLRALALAVGALTLGSAPLPVRAQSSLALYGLVDLSAGRTQAPGGDAADGVDSGKMTTSFIGFKGSEDLGGGLRAAFALERFLRSDTGEAGRFGGDAFWARSAWVGLSSASLGALNLGRYTTSLFVNTLLFNAFGDSFGFSPSIRHYFTSGTTTGDTGWSDSAKYASPGFGGLSFTLHAAANDQGTGSGRNGGASALYFGKAFAAGFAWQKVAQGATIDNTRAWQLGASYDFGAAKLFGQYGTVVNSATGVDHDIAGLGAAGRRQALAADRAPVARRRQRPHDRQRRLRLQPVQAHRRLRGLHARQDRRAGHRQQLRAGHPAPVLTTARSASPARPTSRPT